MYIHKLQVYIDYNYSHTNTLDYDDEISIAVDDVIENIEQVCHRIYNICHQLSMHEDSV